MNSENHTNELIKKKKFDDNEFIENKSISKQYDSMFKNIPEIIFKFAFNKQNELLEDIKENLKKILGNSLKLVQIIK